MPEVSRFYGIVIQMYFADHNPPHFHAFYAGDAVEINIQRLAVMAGRIAPRALGMVIEWATLHQSELLALFDLAQQNQPIHKIDPLP